MLICWPAELLLLELEFIRLLFAAAGLLEVGVLTAVLRPTADGKPPPVKPALPGGSALLVKLFAGLKLLLKLPVPLLLLRLMRLPLFRLPFSCNRLLGIKLLLRLLMLLKIRLFLFIS